MKKKNEEWFIPKETREMLSKNFKELKNKVILEVFIKEGENSQFTEMTKNFIRDLAKLSNKIETEFNKIGDKKAKKYKVFKSPSVLFNPEQYNIRYTGAPAGEEGRSFIETILMVSNRESGLLKQSKEILLNLNEKRHIQVFVTPTCPYCPGQVINAFKAAIEHPDLISSECVESAENPDLANKYNVGSVPHTVINEQTMIIGLKNEEQFISEVVSLEAGKEWIPEAKEEKIEADLIIIGAGPAGLTAGIYAERSGMHTIILEKDTIGGQVSLTPNVENYPGFQIIPGKKLMDMISAHARNYVHIHEEKEVKEIKIGKNIEAITTSGKYVAKAIIIATGATHRKLDVPGEQKFGGHGLSRYFSID